MTYPYTQNVGNLISLIKAIGKHGVPDKFTTKELPIWGFKSSNDRTIVQVLKFIGFVDNGGAPQQLWRDARTNPEAAVAEGTRTSYAELFKMFPDAHRKDVEALTNFFKAKTSVGDAVIRQMVGTFRVLAQYGDFDSLDGIDAATPPPPPSQGQSPSKTPQFSVPLPSANGMAINLNIELALPTDATGEVYDKFFAAMKKHLLG